jgi:NADPH:quinone reductase-like Zn-dependent oxidoreductase
VENLAALRGFIDVGHVRPVVDRTFPFADAPAAIRYLELEHARAKVIITLA